MRDLLPGRHNGILSKGALDNIFFSIIKCALVQQQSVGILRVSLCCRFHRNFRSGRNSVRGAGVKNRTRKSAPEGRADLPSVPVQASRHKKY